MRWGGSACDSLHALSSSGIRPLRLCFTRFSLRSTSEADFRQRCPPTVCVPPFAPLLSSPCMLSHSVVSDILQ